tara:strand:+ start:320 stop:457 length:138 start_codon:yes stop_codon:yes gene_type:complete
MSTIAIQKKSFGMSRSAKVQNISQRPQAKVIEAQIPNSLLQEAKI